MTCTAGAERLNLSDANVVLYRGYLNPDEADTHLVGLDFETDWKQDQILMYQKVLDVPRLSAWFGDRPYTYSGNKMNPRPFTNRLLKLKARIEQLTEQLFGPTGDKFNTVLLNKYRNEYDGVAWHSDDESELGQNPIIGSISLGATRCFQLRRRYQPGETPSQVVNIDLHHGDVLIMSGDTQRNWMHQVPKKTRPKSQRTEQTTLQSLRNEQNVRINLTFRAIKKFSD